MPLSAVPGGRAGLARPTMSDGEDYGFEYSDDDQEEEDVNIENQYYNSKGLLADSDLQGALDGFKEVVTMEDEKGEWGFKAHKQMVRAVHPPRTLPRAAPPGPLRACTEPAASPQQATCCAAAGQAAVQAEELQGDDGDVQGHAHVHQVRSRAPLCPRPLPSALHPSRQHCPPGSQGYDPKQTRAKLGLPLVAPTNVSNTKRRI